MKLPFDENLSPKLVSWLSSEFPESTHPKLLGRQGATDTELWNIARTEGYLIDRLERQ